MSAERKNILLNHRSRDQKTEAVGIEVPPDIELFLEAAVERGEVIDPYLLAQEADYSVDRVRKWLDSHPYAERFSATNGRYKYRSLLEPPKPTDEGSKALEDKKQEYQDEIGRQARADFYELSQERALVAKQKRKAANRVIRRF